MVNPWNAEDVAQAIHEALTMPAETRAANHARLLRHVRRHTAAYWGASFISALEVRTS
jgi:trehalose-6-phosphate synthase